MKTPIRIERTFATTPERLWDLWTTKEGIESWWAPDGFTVEVLASLVDFVPGVDPYTIQNRIDLVPVENGTATVTTIEPLHDEEWTGRLVAGRKSQLDKLEKLVAAV